MRVQILIKCNCPSNNLVNNGKKSIKLPIFTLLTLQDNSPTNKRINKSTWTFI